MSWDDYRFEVFGARIRETRELQEWAKDKRRAMYQEIASNATARDSMDLKNLGVLLIGIQDTLDSHPARMDGDRVYCELCDRIGRPSSWPCEPLRVLMMVLP